MLKDWYKYEHYKVNNNGGLVDYRYFYVCIPRFLRNGLLAGKPITEHRFRLALSIMKVPGKRFPQLMHVSLPFGVWHGLDGWHRTPTTMEVLNNLK